MSAPPVMENHIWSYEPRRDAAIVGICSGCTEPAVGTTTYRCGPRRRVLKHCEEHLPTGPGGQS